VRYLYTPLHSAMALNSLEYVKKRNSKALSENDMSFRIPLGCDLAYEERFDMWQYISSSNATYSD
jgi:hypothetical protein